MRINAKLRRLDGHFSRYVDPRDSVVVPVPVLSLNPVLVPFLVPVPVPVPVLVPFRRRVVQTKRKKKISQEDALFIKKSYILGLFYSYIIGRSCFIKFLFFIFFFLYSSVHWLGIFGISWSILSLGPFSGASALRWQIIFASASPPPRPVAPPKSSSRSPSKIHLTGWQAREY